MSSANTEARQAQEAGAASGPREEFPLVEQLRECINRIFAASANFQARGERPEQEQTRTYEEHLTVVELEDFMESLRSWLISPMGGDRDDLRIVVPNPTVPHFHRMLH